MIACIDPATDAEPDTFEAFLCAALDSADARRIELITRYALVQLDVLRSEDLERLRREGIPPVFKL